MKKTVVKIYTDSSTKKELSRKAKQASRSTSSHGEHLLKKGLKEE